MVKVGMSSLLFVSFLLAIFIPTVANAHSGLENANPEAGTNIKEEIKTIELNFNTKVENGSSLFLVDDEGSKLEPEITEINDDVLKATFQNAFDPGTYEVNWNIVGADGHPVEGTYSFTVIGSKTTQSDENTQNQEETNKKDDKKTTTEDKKDTAIQNASEQESNTDNEESFIDGIIIFLVVATIVLIAWLVFFSKRKK